MELDIYGKQHKQGDSNADWGVVTSAVSTFTLIALITSSPR